MALDSQAQAIAEHWAALPAPNLERLTAEQYRAGIAALMPPAPLLHPEVQSRDITLPCVQATLNARMYRPSLTDVLPVVVYLHGGGFISCGLDTHDNLCRRLALLSGALVVSVQYRLAPEHRFPGPVEDACAAITAVHGLAASLGADPARIAVAGDSAGATLVAVAARLLRDAAVPIAHQLLLYPATDAACDSPSHQEHAQAPLLTTEMMRWFWSQYLPTAQDGLDPRASPLRATDLAGLSPATVLTAGYDPLQHEGQAYALALVAAGVAVTMRHWPGQFHGFASLLGALDAADEALAFAAAQLRHAFER